MAMNYREIPRGVSKEAFALRLKPRLFKIETPIVSEKVYVETRKAVEATGAFITFIRSVSIEDLLEEDKKREQRRFEHNWVESSKTMRATVPPEMEVFINPKAVRIERSNSLSTNEQKTKIAEAQARLKDQLPEGVMPFVSLHMVDPSTYSQLEDAWMDAGNSLLFPDYFARTDVQTVGGHVAGVGRAGPGYRRCVVDWHRGHNVRHAFAVPVGVLPQKLAV